jgi:hypothetical protein
MRNDETDLSFAEFGDSRRPCTVPRKDLEFVEEVNDLKRARCSNRNRRPARRVPRARDASPKPISPAREHLAAAQTSLEKKRYGEARDLAEKALVEAQLAEAKANSARAQRNVTEIREHIATLRREIENASTTRR